MLRIDYLEGRISFDQYYGALAKELGVSFKKSPMLPRIKAALITGDEYLNSIPLRDWDRIAIMYNSGSVNKVLKAHGDSFSLASMVCILKQAAREAATAED